MNSRSSSFARIAVFAILQAFLIGLCQLDAHAEEDITAPEAQQHEEKQANESSGGIPKAATLGGIAESISATTGAAISPLGVMGGLGAYEYFVCDDVEQNWYSHPVIWSLVLFVELLIILKVSGKCTPLNNLCQTLDVTDEAINKTVKPIGGMSVAVPIGLKKATSFAAINESSGGVTYASVIPVEAVPGWGIAIVVTTFVFGIVWMSCSAIDTLIRLCPLPFVEMTSKLLKLVVILGIFAAAALSPVLALILCGIIVFLATRIAGWSYRITVFSFVLLHDWIFRKSARNSVDTESPHAFVKCKAKKIPARTYGRLVNTEGGIVFRYRPVFFAPFREVTLPDSERLITRGIIMSSMTDTTKSKHFCKASFPPRYKKHEESIAQSLQISEIRDCVVLRGIKGVKTWFSETFFERPPKLSETTASA